MWDSDWPGRKCLKCGAKHSFLLPNCPACAKLSKVGLSELVRHRERELEKLRKEDIQKC